MTKQNQYIMTVLYNHIISGMKKGHRRYGVVSFKVWYRSNGIQTECKLDTDNEYTYTCDAQEASHVIEVKVIPTAIDIQHPFRQFYYVKKIRLCSLKFMGVSYSS